jgi:hypothetical protein
MNYFDSKFEIRECATLGTNFVDVYCDGELFAMELSRPVAETFCQYPHMYGNAFAEVAKLRTWIIEQWDRDVSARLKRGK